MLRRLLRLPLQQQPVSGPPRAVPSSCRQRPLPLQQQRWQQWRPPLPQQRACCLTCGPCWRWQQPCSSTRAAGDTHLSSSWCSAFQHFSNCQRHAGGFVGWRSKLSRKFMPDATTPACKQGGLLSQLTAEGAAARAPTPAKLLLRRLHAAAPAVARRWRPALPTWLPKAAWLSQWLVP